MKLALVKRIKKPTNYVLPVYVNGYKCNWYYASESELFKAYRQLKHIQGIFRSLYPIVYGEEIRGEI